MVTKQGRAGPGGRESHKAAIFLAGGALALLWNKLSSTDSWAPLSLVTYAAAVLYSLSLMLQLPSGAPARRAGAWVSVGAGCAMTAWAVLLPRGNPLTVAVALAAASLFVVATAMIPKATRQRYPEPFQLGLFIAAFVMVSQAIASEDLGPWAGSRSVWLVAGVVAVVGLLVLWLAPGATTYEAVSTISLTLMGLALFLSGWHARTPLGRYFYEILGMVLIATGMWLFTKSPKRPRPELAQVGKPSANMSLNLLLAAALTLSAVMLAAYIAVALASDQVSPAVTISSAWAVPIMLWFAFQLAGGPSRAFRVGVALTRDADTKEPSGWS